MGGQISVESAPGVGSAFCVEVPLGIDSTQSAAAHTDDADRDAPFLSTAKPTRKLRILLAEDNVTNRLVAVTRLEMFGHRVDEAASGVEALRMVQSVPYDLLLLDVMMPEMDGLECSRRIRALTGPERNIPIVAMTANVFSHHRDACRSAGMDDFLGKPFTPSQLARVIDRAIAGKLRPQWTAETARAEDDVSAFMRFAEEISPADAIGLLDGFVDELRMRVDRMRIAAIAHEAVPLAREAQAVEEAAASLGMQCIAGQAGRLGASPNAETVAADVAILATTLETVATALQPAVTALQK
jgi:CheY-like chemotaxis protein